MQRLAQKPGSGTAIWRRFLPHSATPARQDVGPRCKPGPAPSTRYVDLTCFRNGAYRVKGVPGPQVNDPANQSPKVAVMATFSNAFTANWGCSEGKASPKPFLSGKLVNLIFSSRAGSG
jgi:hypothetical protein